MGKAARSDSNWTILLGPGPRLAGFEVTARGVLGAVNEGLSCELRRVHDLAELLAEGQRSGRLVLDADSLPAEDLGFVRRFLAERPGWSLELIGEDAGRQTARAVLARPRTRWMAWPPDLAQIEGLLRSPQARVRPAAVESPERGGRRAPEAGFERELTGLAELAGQAREAFARLSDAAQPDAALGAKLGGNLERLSRTAQALAYRAAPPGPAGHALELGALLEEQLAALTLRGKKGPRFLYRGLPGVLVHVQQQALVHALDAILLSARGNAAAGEMIRVELVLGEGAPSEALVRVEFPEGKLAGLDLETLFDPFSDVPRPEELGPHDLAAARSVVEAVGGRLEFAPGAGQTLQALLRLPAEAEGEGAASPAEGVPAGAEDPFA